MKDAKRAGFPLRAVFALRRRAALGRPFGAEGPGGTMGYMRWTDLPADGGPDGAGPSGLRRSEWEQLRQRLERLPAGHPSSPDGETGEDDAWDDESRLEHEAQEGWERASEPPSGAGPEVAARPGSKDRHARRGGNDDAPTRRGGPDGQQSHEGPEAGAADPAPSEPYRPWFAPGESAEPWFASGSQAGLIPPIRDRG